MKEAALHVSGHRFEDHGIGFESVECVTQMLSVQEMLDADEVFLTNCSWGVLPVVGVLGLGEKRAIGDGVPGSLSRELRQHWLDEVRRAAMV